MTAMTIFIKDFLDHYMDQCQILMGYFSLSFNPIDLKPWHNEP